MADFPIPIPGVPFIPGGGGGLFAPRSDDPNVPNYTRAELDQLLQDLGFHRTETPTPIYAAPPGEEPILLGGIAAPVEILPGEGAIAPPVPMPPEPDDFGDPPIPGSSIPNPVMPNPSMEGPANVTQWPGAERLYYPGPPSFVEQPRTPVPAADRPPVQVPRIGEDLAYGLLRRLLRTAGPVGTIIGTVIIPTELDPDDPLPRPFKLDPMPQPVIRPPRAPTFPRVDAPPREYPEHRYDEPPEVPIQPYFPVPNPEDPVKVPRPDPINVPRPQEPAPRPQRIPAPRAPQPSPSPIPRVARVLVPVLEQVLERLLTPRVQRGRAFDPSLFRFADPVPQPVGDPLPSPQPIPPPELTPPIPGLSEPDLHDGSAPAFAEPATLTPRRTSERDCRCPKPRKKRANPSRTVAQVKPFSRRMSRNSLDNLRRGKKP